MTFKVLLTFILLTSLNHSFGQKPKNGTYIYKVAFAEWEGKSLGANVLVKIKGDSIYIIHTGGNLSAIKETLLPAELL